MQKLSLAIVFILLVICMCFTVSIRWKGENNAAWKEIVSSDGKGYYAYLPALFIYHDFNFTFLENKKLVPDGYASSFQVPNGNRKVDKYFCGVAVLQAPFFMMAQGFCKFSGYANDGYSMPFQLSVSIAALAYLLLGLWFLRKLLLSFSFPEWVIAWVLVLILFGTNLFYYACIAPSMSHVYSFAMMAMFFYYSKRMFSESLAKLIIPVVSLLAIIALIRPNNMIVVLLWPFFAEHSSRFSTFVKEMKSKTKLLLYACIVPILLICIQLLLWYQQTGHWVVWSYKGEGFDFGHAHWMQSLFGFRKGLFVYTPLLLLSLLAFVPLYKNNKYQFKSVAVFLFLLFYITSSWWNWYFGSSFGLRPYIDFYPLFAVLLAFVFASLRSNALKLIVVGISVLLLIISGIQTYQYMHFIIHPEDMNFEKYKFVFLRTDDKYRGVLAGTNDVVYGKLNMNKAFSSFNDFEQEKNGWNSASIVRCNERDAKPSNMLLLDNEHEFGATYRVEHVDDFIKQPTYLKVSLNKREKEPNAGANSYLVIAVDSAGTKTKYWNGNVLNDLPYDDFDTWRNLQFEISLPPIHSKNANLSIYVWNPNKKRFYVDDMRIELYSVE